MRGWPDYTRVTGLVDNYDEYGQNYPVGGGDIAARIGSTKTHDMRGRVWWIDDFEAGTLHWTTFSWGVGGSQGLSTAEAWYGTQCAILTANTGAGRHSLIYQEAGRPRSNRIGLETTYSLENTSAYVTIDLEIDNAVTRPHAQLRLNMIAAQVEYLNQAGAWIDTGIDIGIIGMADTFVNTKIVADFDTNEWIRIIHNYDELDMTGIPLHSAGAGFVNSIRLEYDNLGDNAVNSKTYINNTIVTVMEPR